MSVAYRPETAPVAVSLALAEYALRTLIREGDVDAAVAALAEPGRPEIDGRAARLLDRLRAEEGGRLLLGRDG